MTSTSRAINFTKGMPFSDAYVANNTLYVAGQQGPSSSGNTLDVDITEQTTNSIHAVRKVLEEGGFRMSDITSVTVYFTDFDDVSAINAVYNAFIPDPKPARVAVQVVGLIGGAKIEISAIAVRY